MTNSEPLITIQYAQKHCNRVVNRVYNETVIKNVMDRIQVEWCNHFLIHTVHKYGTLPNQEGLDTRFVLALSPFPVSRSGECDLSKVTHASFSSCGETLKAFSSNPQLNKNNNDIPCENSST